MSFSADDSATPGRGRVGDAVMVGRVAKLAPEGVRPGRGCVDAAVPWLPPEAPTESCDVSEPATTPEGITNPPIDELLERFPEWDVDLDRARIAPTSTVRGFETLTLKM